MRTAAIALALMMIAAPVAAQPAPPAAPNPALRKPAPPMAAGPDRTLDVVRRIADPATADRLAGMMQSLGKAFLDLPVGEIAAAAEGRPVTTADKRLTVRDVGRRDDPDFDRKFAAQMASARPMMQQSLKAIGNALPAITQSLKQAGDAIERATANLPDPTYPRR